MCRVQGVGGSDGGARLHVRMPAHASSVPAARRFVVDGLTAWDRADLVDDAALCVTELVSNATLHGGGGGLVDIHLSEASGAVHLAVEDRGHVPVDAVAARWPGRRRSADPLDDEPGTGRGLGIVAHLADSWGVDRMEDGKRVWVRLAEGVDQSAPATRDLAAPADRPVDDVLPDGWHLVRLVDCPVALSLRQDQHLDEIIRELQLVDAGGRRESAELARLIERQVSRQAHARHTGRRTAMEADAAGLELIDIAMPVPRDAAVDVVALQHSVTLADELCDAAELLTLGSPPQVRALRAWMVDQFVQQIEHGRPPAGFADWLAAQEQRNDPVAPDDGDRRRGQPMTGESPSSSSANRDR